MTTDAERQIAAVIGGAQEVRDPLDALVEQSKTDVSAPFAPDVLAALDELKRTDRRAFEGCRARLKDAGVRITALDEAIATIDGQSSTGRGPKQADILIELATAGDLFHAPNGTGFADVEISGHRETWPIRSKGFRQWLAREFYESTGGAPNSEAILSALNVIEAKARFEAAERDIYVRVAGLEGRLYIDLADKGWRAIEVDTDGWRIIATPPVRFRRAAGMQPLPMPTPGGSIETLRRYLNIRNDADFVLVVSWMLAVMRDQGPYPIMVLSGEQGSAKSTFAAILRALLDPNAAPLRALPREDRDLFIAATNGHILAFDNVSGVAPWISDTLCRLATGGGFAVRQLYTDQDEVLFEATRPVILNGIEDIVTRPDLADRALFLHLDPIAEQDRRPEHALWAAFRRDAPGILGVLLDALVLGLQRLPTTHLDRHPRMADFARWASASETAFWPAGTFMAAYTRNREDAVENVIEADPVASTLRSWFAGQTEWMGTATDLLGALTEHASEAVRRAKTWPSTPRTLSGRLRRAATFLRSVGVHIDFDHKTGRKRNRTIIISSGADQSSPCASAASAPSADTPMTGDVEPAARTQTAVADANHRPAEGQATPSALPAPDSGPADDADGADAEIFVHSGHGPTGSTTDHPTTYREY